MSFARVSNWTLAAAAFIGCFTAHGQQVTQPEHGRFHHVHLNVSDTTKTAVFYEKVFGVTPTKYRGVGPALMADRAFIFLSQPAGPIASQLQTGLIHIGWGGVDAKSEFEWWKSQGIEFHTPLTQVGDWSFFYLYGPDREVIEIYTMEKHHRFNHVHMLATDPNATAEWFAKVINSESPVTSEPLGVGPTKISTVDLGDVGLHVLPDIGPLRPRERTGAMQNTDGSGIDHIAISFRDLNAAFARIKAAGIRIERPIAMDAAFGVKSFFVRAPNGVLVELAEAKPLPEAAWE